MATVSLYETPEQLNTLHKASEVKAVSDAAVAIQELNAIARLINRAANVGEHSAVWNHPISNDAKSKLESNGYTVAEPKRRASDDRSWVISWM